MKPNKCDHIVNITAAIALQPNLAIPALLPTTTKGAINSAIKGLALELANDNIRVNGIALGIIETPMHIQYHQSLAMLKSFCPSNSIGQATDIADAVLYLTDSQFVTGTIMVVDGGSTAGKW